MNLLSVIGTMLRESSPDAGRTGVSPLFKFFCIAISERRPMGTYPVVAG
jgi:hypothetical protein